MNLRRYEQMFIFMKHAQKWLKISRHRYRYNVSMLTGGPNQNILSNSW